MIVAVPWPAVIVPPVTVHVGVSVPEPVKVVPVFAGTVHVYVALLIVCGLLLRFVAQITVLPVIDVTGGIGLTAIDVVDVVTVPALPSGSASAIVSVTLTEVVVTFGHTGAGTHDTTIVFVP